MVVALLDRAWKARESFRARLATEGTDTFRLFTGFGDRIDGFVVDKYASVAVAMEHVGRCDMSEADWKEAAEWLLANAGVTAVYRKRLDVDRSGAQAPSTLYEPTPFAGVTAEPRVAAHEHGLAFGIEPYGGFSTGLFLDQRENRHFLAKLAAGGDVLNAFAYTCGFSVAAARAGAKTTSIDLSKKWLDWGRENFARNHLSTDGHSFIAEDAFLYFQRAAKRGRKFSLVILDPPSFARGKKGAFSVKKHIGPLVEAALPVVAPGGHLFVSSNFSEWNSDDLRTRISEVCQGKVEALPPVDEDFRQQTSALACCLLRIE